MAACKNAFGGPVCLGAGGGCRPAGLGLNCRELAPSCRGELGCVVRAGEDFSRMWTLFEIHQPPSLGLLVGVGGGWSGSLWGWWGGLLPGWTCLATRLENRTYPCMRTWLALPWAIAQYRPCFRAGRCKNAALASWPSPSSLSDVARSDWSLSSIPDPWQPAISLISLSSVCPQLLTALCWTGQG